MQILTVCHPILSYLLWYLTMVDVGCSVRSYVCADLLSTHEGSPSKGGAFAPPLSPPGSATEVFTQTLSSGSALRVK